MAKKETMVDRKCIACGKDFQTTLHKANIGQGIYCGRKCAVKKMNGVMRSFVPADKRVPV